MRFNDLKETLKAAVLAMTVLLATATVSSAQTVNLTASQQSATLPDGTAVPMWGWTCGTGANAAGSLGSSLSSITVTNTTTVFTAPVTVVIGAPNVTGGTQATATATLSATGTIASISITNPGSGYTAAPSITVNGTAGVATVAIGGVANCTALTYTTPTGAVAATPQPQIGAMAWQPPLISVPYTSSAGVSTTNLTINLTNTLPVGTSIMILGQAGGGLGGTTFGTGPGGTAGPAREAAPRADGAHAGQTATTWTTVTATTFTPPAQERRARSFVPEVLGVASALAAGTASPSGVYTWTGLKPGTYLIRSGTYPSIQGPMGLYGVLVVTTAAIAGGAAGTAYPAPAAVAAAAGVTYDADVVALESEIDPRQNRAVAALFPTACTGVNTPVAGCTAAGAALPTGAATANPGFSETAKWNITCGAGLNGLTSNGTLPTCYPPAVDYTPLYFLINGVAFSRANQTASALEVPAPSTAAGRGNVLIRFVNAGSHMHVPSVNGLNALLVAEDAFVNPDVALALGWSGGTPKTLTATSQTTACATTATVACGLRLQTEVFQPSGKVYDVLVSPPTTTGTYLIYDRSLALGTAGLADGSGMQAVLDVNDGGAATLATASSGFAATANAATYTCVPGVTLIISDPGKGVIANDANVLGVALSPRQLNNTLTPFGSGSSTDSLTLNPDGTFTYTQASANTSCGGSFTYQANSNGPTATVTIAQATPSGTVTANPDSYNSNVATLLRVGAPGVLGNDTDSNNYPLCAAPVAAASGPTHCPSAVQTIAGTNGATISLSADGSFTAQLATPPAVGTTVTSTFTYVAANSQGLASTPGTVTLTFQGGSGLHVTVQDAPCVATATAANLANCAIKDYKWIIEQDLTFPIDPKCQVNSGAGSVAPVGCPALGPGGVPPTPATNFHTSFMPVIAEGCTGPQSCGRGQTVYDGGVKCTTPGVPVGCSSTSGQHVQAACDGYGTCFIGASQLTPATPDQAHLAASNPDGTPARYYISILPGDSSNAFATSNTSDPAVAANCGPGTEPSGMAVASKCSHTMGGAPVPPATSFAGGVCTQSSPGAVGPGTTYSNCTYPSTANLTINLQPAPVPTATVTAFIFEDNYPLNGEPDTGGGVDSLATLEVPLGDFQIAIWDDAGGVGDFTGQMTYDMFNMPLTNALNGTIDPNTGFDACPISNTQGVAAGVIIVCPQYEADGKTPSPLTGQVVVKNLMQGKFSLIAHPGAAREAAGEEWLQTNSLDGGHFLDSFIKPGEPPYFQEFGPGGYHVFFGMANPAHINARLKSICSGTTQTPPVPFGPPCNNNLTGQVANLHQDRTPSEQLFSGGVFGQNDPRNYAPLGYTTCYAAIGDTDGATIALAKCDQDGKFTFTGLPNGNYGIVLFDQWNDFIVDGSSHAITLPDPTQGSNVSMMFPSFTWQAHLWSRSYMDVNGQGRPNLDPNGNLDPATSPGLIQVPTRIRQVNGKFVNTLLADIGGNSRFDETFPLFAFYTVESDNTRFRTTGIHVVNDAGGPVDGPSAGGGNGITGTAQTQPYQGVLNSIETFSLPADLRVPGAVYCARGDAACLNTSATGSSATPGTCTPASNSGCISTGRIDPGSVDVEGWQGGVSQFDTIDWGKMPYYVSPAGAAENGGIRGHVVNATTRPFDDPRMLFQNLWEPLVPRVQINLYQEGFAPDGVTPTLTLVDSTTTASWDDWAQGFGLGGRVAGIPNMSCAGQDTADPFFTYTLTGTTNYLTPGTAIPHNSQYKCYDGYHNLNQIQPAPYDGLFKFPSHECLTGTTFHLVPGATTGQTANCVTIANPAFGVAGQTGAAPKILPPGKYVTEVILPPGWQLNKEEDLNLLIGDQYIAPAVNQFTGLGAIFITPDQASINAANNSYTGPYTGTAVNGTSGPYTPPWNCSGPPSAPSTNPCMLTPNTTNNGKQSTDYGRSTFGNFGPGGLIVQSAPCVGRMRIVPDYLSIAPESGEVAPFAGSLRPLCDRKEITLDNQMQADVDFYIYTNTPKTTSFTGFISDDFSSEFDPASPAFGEKFAVPNVPVSIRDFNGQEISRVYSDQWGVFNGLVYSTWEVDPPNITGYSPNMMVTCMNDPGPIPDPNNPGQFINDPFYNPQYSTFCYENPFMPGDTTYLDTPVVPVSAFAEGYNPPDCAYPDGTPMIQSVLGDVIPGSTGGRGPWVSAVGHTVTINAFAPTTLATPIVVNGVSTTAGPGVHVPNNAYSGPSATSQPYNQKFATRHYGFGAARGTVTMGGRPAACGTWTDAQLVCTVPPPLPLVGSSGCPELPQTNASTGALNTSARCGELVITTASGKQSIDTVTITAFPSVHNSTTNTFNPTFVAGEDSTGHAIQNAIDKALPGDLIVVGCATGQTSCTYSEMLLMWKPLRLQGIGDGAVTVNANTHPAGKLLEPWRRKVNCLFGLALNGGFIGAGNPYDPSGQFPCSSSAPPNSPVDAIVGEPIVGWDATLNGNLAELLQEPTLMGAYEGAGITVLAKGLENANTTACTVENAAGCIPLNAITTSGGDCNRSSAFYTGNFLCNPSRIDGLTFTNSSQGGGGVFLHGFNHYMQVSNLNVTGNGGTLTGGITLGQMETVDPTTAAVTGGTIQQAMMYNHHVNIHHNRVTSNAAYGDELNSNTPASAGGVTLCTGSDYYMFEYNWICGNWSSGDGGGVAHHGFSWDGTIQNNWIVFNQSINPSLVTNGGGLVVHGFAPDGTLGEAGTAGDVDVAPALTTGIGPGLMIKNNVFQGNTAEEGQGGGMSLLHINGNDVLNNPTNPGSCTGNGLTELWYCVTVVDNIFANNVAGWTGGGVSLLDAVLVDFHNNTVASNDSTSSAGVVFYSNGAPLGNVPPPGCNPQNFGCTGAIPNLTTSVALPAGLVTEKHSQNLSTAFATFLASTSATCPTGHTTASDTKACAKFSIPRLDADIFWQNRAFNIATNASNGTNAVVLSPNLTQTATGACPSSTNYWDVGVYGDAGPNGAATGNPRLTITHSTLSSGGYSGAGNNGANPNFPHQYCNGSRVPPEIAALLCASNANAPGCIRPGAVGISTWGGVPDSSVPPNPLFSISPAATIDEGNNWINMFYGPLTLTCPITTTTGGASTCGTVATSGPLGNYATPRNDRGAQVTTNLPTYPNP